MGLKDSEKPQPTGPTAFAAWHDVQVRVEGPAVADLWQSFVQRFSEVVVSHYSYFTPADYLGRLIFGETSLREPQPIDSQRSPTFRSDKGPRAIHMLHMLNEWSTYRI